MIPPHAEIYRELSTIQAYALWCELAHQRIIPPCPGPGEVSGEKLAQACDGLSHAQVVMAVASKSNPFWCDLIGVLVRQPIYMCARGETGIPLTDYEGRPIPHPVGGRRGHVLGGGLLPGRIGNVMSRAPRRDPRIISRVRLPNPKAAGTKSAARYDLYREGMTVSEFLALGGSAMDVKVDLARGNIDVVLP